MKFYSYKEGADCEKKSFSYAEGWGHRRYGGKSHTKMGAPKGGRRVERLPCLLSRSVNKFWTRNFRIL